MCSHSAPPLIMRLHSAVSWPKSEASTDGDTIALGMLAVAVVVGTVCGQSIHKRLRGKRRSSIDDVGR